MGGGEKELFGLVLKNFEKFPSEEGMSGDVLGGKSITVLSSISKRAHTRTRDAISLSLSLSHLCKRVVCVFSLLLLLIIITTRAVSQISQPCCSLIYIFKQSIGV